jgi:hypothetical protein
MVARQVRRLEAAGIDRDQAIRHAAAESGIAPEKVRWCADTAPGDVSARPTDHGRGATVPCRHSERHAPDYNKTRRTGAALRSRARRVRAPLAPAAA